MVNHVECIFRWRKNRIISIVNSLHGWRKCVCSKNIINNFIYSQTLKYVLVQSPEMVAKMQPLVHWAAYLPPEQGQPKPDETPVLFVAVCQDESLPGCNDTDTGLALANMTDAAWAHGVGSCIMGAIDRPAIKELLGLGENLRLHSVVAFGYPTHKSHLVAMQNGNVKYYLDDARDYCVPKRPMEEILLKTL